MGNPFVPTFGSRPPILAGRDRGDVIADIADGLDAGPGHPERAAVLIGPRGVGKTVMLNAIQDEASERGWLVISLDASGGTFVSQLARYLMAIQAAFDGPPPKRLLTGAKAFGIELSTSPLPVPDPDFDLRVALTGVCAQLNQQETGLLVTVDEIQAALRTEVTLFGATFQHVAQRERLPLAFAAAGFPTFRDERAADVAATFLQRCSWHEITDIPEADVRAAFRRTVESADGTITDAALDIATTAVNGYAYMFQLVGHHSWRASGDGHITAEHAERGVEEARRRMGRAIFEPMWRGTSQLARQFLMTVVAAPTDEVPIAFVRERLGRTKQLTNEYRAQLIQLGWIRQVRRGVVALRHWSARDWLRDRDDSGVR